MAFDLLSNDSAVPPSRCPQCFKLNDRATHIRNEAVTPAPGDFTVCFSCGAILLFNDSLFLVACGDRELAAAVRAGELDVQQVSQIMAAQSAILDRARRS